MSELPWSLWRFTGVALTPKSAMDLKLVQEKYGIDTVLRAKFAQSRSPQHHRLYWSVLDKVVEATGQWASVEDLHEALKLHMRMVRGIDLIGGGTRFITRSINFTDMDQGEFNLFFKKAMVAIEESTGIDTDRIIAEAKKHCGHQQAA